MKKLIIKISSLTLLLAFFADTVCYGLATLPASENPIIKREVLAALQRTQIRYADSEYAKGLLRANDAECLLLSSGKYLVAEEIARNDLRLLRAIIHEDVEAIMQIIAKEDRYKYQGIKELILKYFPPDKDNKLPIELYVNHTVARAFEWLILIEERAVFRDEVPMQEEDFISRIEKIINSNRHNYFTSEFRDTDERSKKIRLALNGGMRFYQVASDARKDPELKEGARSLAPPIAPAKINDEPFLVGLEDELFIKTKPDYLTDMPREVVSLVRSVSSIDQLEEMLKKIALEAQNGAQVRKEFLPHLEKIALIFGLEHNPNDILTSWGSVFKNMQVPQRDKDLIDAIFHADKNFISPYPFNDVIPAVDKALDNIPPEPGRYTVDSRIKQYLSLMRKLRAVLSDIEGPGVYEHPMTVREILERALRHKEAIAANADNYLDDIIGFKLFINNIGMNADQREEAMERYSDLVEQQVSGLKGVSVRTVKRASHASGFGTVNIYLHGLLTHKDFGELPVKIQLRFISGIYREAAMYYSYKVYKRWDMPPWAQTINFEDVASFRQLQELLLANFKKYFESCGPIDSITTGDILIMPGGRQPGSDIARVSERAAGEINYGKFLITGPYPIGGQGGFRFAALDRKIKENGFFGITASERYTYIELLINNFRLLNYSEAVSERSREKMRNLSEDRRKSFAHVSKHMLFDVLDAARNAPEPPSLRDLEYLPNSPKLLFISPYEKKELKVGSFLAPAMGVYRLASYLRLFGIRVNVFDPNLEDTKDLEELVRSGSYDFIGSSIYEPTLENDISLARKLKKISPGSIFIAGGEGAYYNRKRIFDEDTPYDVIARGFGEFSLLDMVAAHMRKGAGFLKDPDESRAIEGLLVRTGNGITETPSPKRITPDDYRAISLFSDTSVVPYEEYWNFMEGLYSAGQTKVVKGASPESIRTVRLVTESHCPMGCSFCSSTHFLDDSVSGKRQPVLFLTADEIMMTLKNVIRYHPGVRTIFFNDDNFMINRERIMQLCDRIEEGFGRDRLKFIALGRVDNVDFEMLKRMKEVGFIQLNYGIESLSDRVLRDMKKSIKAKKNIEGLEITLLAGIKPLIALIPFYPTATMDDVRETMEISVEFVNMGAGLTYWPFVEAFKGASITEKAESGEYDLTGDGKNILPTDKRVRECALKAVQGTGAVIEEIKKQYGVEGRLPHVIDVLAFFIAFYRASGMDAKYIERAVKSNMLNLTGGGEQEADIVSSDGKVEIAGSAAPDYYRYRKKNDPATNEYGITMVAGLPIPDDILKIKDVINRVVSNFIGSGNMYSSNPGQTHTTISPMLRSSDKPITSITNAKGYSIDMEKMLDAVKDAGPFTAKFTKVMVDSRGGISLRGTAAEHAESLLSLRKGLIVDANFEGRVQDLSAEMHIAIGYIRNFDRLSREQKEALAKRIGQALEGQEDLGVFRVDKINLVYYQHRSLSKLVNKIGLELGKDHPGLRDKTEKILLEGNAERLDIIEVDSSTGEETVTGAVTRDEAHARGLLHRVSNIILLSPEGEVVLQKRAPWTTSYPGLWSITGGHVSSGDSYRKTAVSEMKQELGIICDEARLFPIGGEGSYAYSREYGNVKNRERKALYYYVLNEEENGRLKEQKERLLKTPREELKAMGNEGEVSDLDWKSIEDLESELRQDSAKSVYAETLLRDLFPNKDASDLIKQLIKNLRQTVFGVDQPSYDVEQIMFLSSDLIYTQLQEDKMYEIKYDTYRLSESQIEIIEEYAKLLRLRSLYPGNIKLRPFSSDQGSKESLVAVYCTGKDFKGEGHVDVSIPDGELKEYLLRITGMINIALASSNIPDNLLREEVDKYRPIMSYIRNQYKAILGEELDIPDSPEDILKVIRRIVLGLPKSMRMNTEQIEEFNRLAKQALTAA